QKRLLHLRVGQGIFPADDADETRQQIGRQRADARMLGLQIHELPLLLTLSFGAAARSRRSLIASPRPSFGIFITAMPPAPEASSARKCENKLDAASTILPRAERLSVTPAAGAGPKASSASPVRAASAFRRSRAMGA